MPDLIVRPGIPADIAAMHSIYRHAVIDGTASWEYAPPDAVEMGRRFETIKSAGYPNLVAERGGQVIGYAYASSYRLRPGYRFTVENSVYVAAEVQRSGAGRALLSALVDACTAQGFRQMVAVIGDSANSASIGLHRMQGFTFCGVIHGIGWKHGRWLDSVIMQRALGEADTSAPDLPP